MTTVLIRTAHPDPHATPEPGHVLAGARRTSAPAADDIVDQWGRQSFPASDPPANS